MNQILLNERPSASTVIDCGTKMETQGAFETRLTPMNFYPLICGAPDQRQAKRMLDLLTDPKKFWGRWIIPTLCYDDPDWHYQGYWKGNAWPPVNYLVWLGLKRYGTPEQRGRLAQRSVEMFMQNWISKGMWRKFQKLDNTRTASRTTLGELFSALSVWKLSWTSDRMEGRSRGAGPIFQRRHRVEKYSCRRAVIPTLLKSR